MSTPTPQQPAEEQPVTTTNNNPPPPVNNPRPPVNGPPMFKMVLDWEIKTMPPHVKKQMMEEAYERIARTLEPM